MINSRSSVVTIPLLGFAVAVGTIIILAAPNDWASMLRTEPESVVFVGGLLILAVAPHLVLALVLTRGRTRWLRRAALIASVAATAGQTVVAVILFTEDDPQTPILLALYLPAQCLGVAVLILIGLLIGRLTRRSSTPVNSGEPSDR